MASSLHLYAFLVLAAGGLVLTLGDIVFKYWIGYSHPLLYGIGFSLYMIGLVLLIRSYRYENIAIASTVFELINLVTLAIVSWILFKEHLSYIQMAGIGTAIVAVLLLELG